MNETVYSSEFQGFTTIPNKILKDERVNLQTIGLYVIMSELLNTGITSFNVEMLLRSNTTREEIEDCLKTLQEAGYINMKEGDKDVK